MSEGLKGRVAVVTGSGQGIGKAIALDMAKEGARVVTNNRKPGSTKFISRDPFLNKLDEEQREWIVKQEAEMSGDAETTANEIRDMGGEAVAFFGDVSDYEVAGNLIKTAVDNFGKIDILVNNAGTYHMSPIWEITPKIWYRVLNPHLIGTWNCTRHSAGLMKEQRWGRIINAVSGAWLGQKYGSNYSSSKGGIVGLTRAVAKDLYDYGVTCNAFSPGAWTRGGVSFAMHHMVRAAAGTPIGPEERSRLVGTEEDRQGPEMLAPFIVYLATEEAAEISGSVFAVRGNHIGLYSEPTEITTLDKEEGLWTVDELVEQAPKILLKGYKSKASPGATE